MSFIANNFRRCVSALLGLLFVTYVICGVAGVRITQKERAYDNPSGYCLQLAHALPESGTIAPLDSHTEPDQNLSPEIRFRPIEIAFFSRPFHQLSGYIDINPTIHAP